MNTVRPKTQAKPRARPFAVFDRRRWRDLLRDPERPRRTSLSFGLGAAVGATPILGIHTWAAASLAAVLRLPPLAAVLGSNLSNPVTFVPITLVEIRIGQALLGRPWHALPPEFSASELGAYLLSAWLGCLVVGPVMGLLAYGALSAFLYARGRHRSTPAAGLDEADAGVPRSR